MRIVVWQGRAPTGGARAARRYRGRKAGTYNVFQLRVGLFELLRQVLFLPVSAGLSPHTVYSGFPREAPIRV